MNKNTQHVCTYVDFGHSPVIACDLELCSATFGFADQVSASISLPLTGLGVESDSLMVVDFSNSTPSPLTILYCYETQIEIFFLGFVKLLAAG